MGIVSGLLTSQKKEPASAPGPPFVAGSAVNGLSLDGAGRIVLGNVVGGSAAALLNSREIPMAGFSFEMLNGLASQFLIDPATGEYAIGDSDGLAGGLTMIIDNVQRSVDIGDFQGVANGHLIHLTDNVGGGVVISGDEFRVQNVANKQFFQVEPSLQFYKLGDISTTVNGSQIIIDDNLQTFEYKSGGNDFLLMDPQNDQYAFGDINAKQNQTIAMINDTAKSFKISQTANIYLSIDKGNNQYSIGDIDAVLRHTRLLLDDGAAQTKLYSSDGFFYLDDFAHTFLSLDPVNGFYDMGDISAKNGGSFIEIDDMNFLFVVDNTAHNMQQQINNPTVDVNQTILLQSLTNNAFDGVKVYANNLTTYAKLGWAGLETQGGTSINTVSGADILFTFGGVTKFNINTTNGVNTADPGGGTGQWLLGKVKAGAVALDAANYVETKIDGVTVKLLKAA